MSRATYSRQYEFSRLHPSFAIVDCCHILGGYFPTCNETSKAAALCSAPRAFDSDVSQSCTADTRVKEIRLSGSTTTEATSGDVKTSRQRWAYGTRGKTHQQSIPQPPPPPLSFVYPPTRPFSSETFSCPIYVVKHVYTCRTRTNETTSDTRKFRLANERGRLCVCVLGGGGGGGARAC